MKRIIVIAGLFLTLSAPSVMGINAVGSAFGSLCTAESMGMGSGRFGCGLGIADATSVTGTFGYGLSKYTDGRLKLGLIDADTDDTEITLGADIKYQLWSVSTDRSQPFDLGVGGLFEYVSFGNHNILQLGTFVIGSYPARLASGKVLTPYGRFNVRLERYSNSDSESEIEFGLNGGVAFSLSRYVVIYGEFQIDGNDGIFFGLDYSVL